MDLFETHGVLLPRPIFVLVSYFLENSHHMKLEGLFRQCGSERSIDALNTHLMFCDYKVMSDYDSKPHDVANLLKRILREMGEPIIPFSAYNMFMEINQNKVKDGEKRLQML